MKILKIIFLVLLCTNLSAQIRTAVAVPSLPIELMPSEAWVKLSCFGVVTPKYQTPIEQAIMVAHIKVNLNQPYPKFEDLRDQNSDFIKNLTKLCTERRWSKVILGNFTGTWLDWGTDWGYSRLEIGEEFIYNSYQCRAVGKPCERLSQCCGYAQRMVSCNLTTRTCESNAISSSTSTNIPRSL